MMMNDTGNRQRSEITPEPKKRTKIRKKIGRLYYSLKRYRLWFRMRKEFASKRDETPLEYKAAEHKTILLRKLKDVDMWMQYNKITNLKIAAGKINGIILKPGEVFSYWKLIGKTTKAKGYKKGMILRSGKLEAGYGGGLCQLSNLIFWMTLHTPLTVIERHRHGYDVFPDSNRTQPFASGATCAYPHIDLMIRNDTPDDYQLLINVGDEYLEGEWRSSAAPTRRYEIVERNHRMQSEYWGGYTRRNEIYRLTYDLDGNLLDDSLIIKNSAIMMYSPLIDSSASNDFSSENTID